MEVPHLLTLARLAQGARPVPDRTQAPDQVGCGRHLGTDPGGDTVRGGLCGRHRLDRVGGLNRLLCPPARCRSQKKGAPGRSEPDDHALGRSRGGLSTKVHLASDSHARPLALHVTAGQAGDAPAFEAVMAGIRVPRSGLGGPRTRPTTVLADRAYSSRAIRAHLRRRAIRAVIPQPADQIRHRLRQGQAGGRPPGFDPEAQRSATPLNAASPASSSGAASPCEPTNSPSPMRPPSTSPPS